MSNCCSDFSCAKCQERRAARGKLLAGVDVNRIQDKVSGPPPVRSRFPQDRLPNKLLRDFQRRNKAIGERIEAQRKAEVQALREESRRQALSRAEGMRAEIARRAAEHSMICVVCPTPESVEAFREFTQGMLERGEIDHLPEVRLMTKPLA